MKTLQTKIVFYTLAAFALTVLLTFSVQCHAASAEEPVLDDSTTTEKLQSLPRAEGPRKVVTIYRFRSSVPELTAENATDMFLTALIKSGAFDVVERYRLNEGVMAEKQLNSQGLTDGDSVEHRLEGADYIFEGSVTEANAKEGRTGVAGTFRGLGIEMSGERAEIGLDVRVVDARTGRVLDAVNVRKSVKEDGFSVSGVGSFLRDVTNKNLNGGDLGVVNDKKEGVDRALRACIEEAVYELVNRFAD